MKINHAQNKGHITFDDNMRQTIHNRIKDLEMRNFASKDQPVERLGQKPTGLRGGGANKSIKPNKTTTYLQLTNAHNDCFVNSVIQLVSATGYGTFLREQFPQLLEGAHPQSFKLSRLLANLYCGQSKLYQKS